MESNTGLFGVRSSLIALLALVGFSVEVSSSIGTGIGWISPDSQFGLLQVIPYFYWIGFSLILVSIVLGVRNKNENLFFLQGMLLFISIWGAPSFFEPFPSVWDSYVHYSSAESLIRSGFSTIDTTSYVYNYPGFFVLAAQYTLLGSVPALSFVQFYPLFSSLLTLLALFLFVRTYVPRPYFRYALIVCILSNVWIQVHFSPQSLGFAAGLLVLVFLEKEGLEWFLASILTFTFLVVSHPTTTILVLGVIVIKEVIARARRLSKETHPARMDRPAPITTFLLIWIFWLFSGAVTFSGLLEEQVGSRIASFFEDLPHHAANIVGERISGNLFAIPPLIRTAALGALVLIAAIALLIFLLKRKKLEFRISETVIAVIVMPFVIVPLDIALFNGQFYDRGFLYLALGTSIVAAIFITGLLRGYLRMIFVAGLLILVGASASTTLYQESLYIVGPEAISASDFLNDHIHNDSFVLGGLYPDHVWGIEPPSDFSKRSFAQVYPDTYYNITIDHPAGSAMVFDRSSELWSRQYGTIKLYNFYLDQTPFDNRVYDSGAYEIYSGGTAGQ